MKRILLNILGTLVVPSASFVVPPAGSHWMTSSALQSAGRKNGCGGGGTDICPLLPPPDDPSATLEVAAG